MSEEVDMWDQPKGSEGTVSNSVRRYTAQWGLPHVPVKPPIVCICGSSRFCDVAAVYAWEMEKRGEIALSMHLLPQWYWEATNKVGHGHGAEQEGVAHILDELHLRKIDMCDRVFVVNEGGYIGERTAIEIAYAKAHGKPVTYLSDLDQPPVTEPDAEK